MGQCKTVYLSNEVNKFLDDTDSASIRVSSIIRRYQAVCRNHLPLLTREQWQAVCDANILASDKATKGDTESLLWVRVAEAEGLDQKWAIDVDELVRTMRTWSAVERIAAAEAVRTFWVEIGSDATTAEALRRAGMSYQADLKDK